MADTRASPSTPALSRRPSPSDSPVPPTLRRQSTTGFGSSRRSSSSMSLHSSPGNTSPRVQLVPHIHRSSYDFSLSQSEKEVLDSTSFDASDLSSKDFDFEDIFTYDKPQKKLPSVLEVSSPSRDKESSDFSFSHYTPTTTVRQKVSRARSGIGEMYVKNKSDARKR